MKNQMKFIEMFIGLHIMNHALLDGGGGLFIITTSLLLLSMWCELELMAYFIGKFSTFVC